MLYNDLVLLKKTSAESILMNNFFSVYEKYKIAI